MLSRINSKKAIIFGVLALLLAFTRGNHFGLTADLPSASTAVFLLAGFFLGGFISFVALLGQAFSMDLLAVARGNMDYAACFNQAYGFLLPAYGALWLGGRWLARHYEDNAMMIVKTAVVTFSSATVAFLITKTSFYFLSGLYETSLNGYAAKLADSYIGYMTTPLIYVALAALVYAIAVAVMQQSRQPSV